MGSGDAEDADRLKTRKEVVTRGDPPSQTCIGHGSETPRLSKKQAWAVPSRGPSWLQELHLFIIAIYIVPGICRRLHQPHMLMRPTMPWEHSLPGPARR
jgi:hypothetical protein